MIWHQYISTWIWRMLSEWINDSNDRKSFWDKFPISLECDKNVYKNISDTIHCHAITTFGIHIFMIFSTMFQNFKDMIKYFFVYRNYVELTATWECIVLHAWSGFILHGHILKYKERKYPEYFDFQHQIMRQVIAYITLSIFIVFWLLPLI